MNPIKSNAGKVTSEMVDAGLVALRNHGASDVVAIYAAMWEASALRGELESGRVLVPKIPTPKMLEAAWADALAENAEGGLERDDRRRSL